MKTITILRAILVISMFLLPSAAFANPPIPILVKDIYPGGNGLDYYYTRFDYQGKLWFEGEDGISRDQWWISDGTTEGTQPSPLMGNTSEYRIIEYNQPMVMNNIAYFIAYQSAGIINLWRTDGTPEGTWAVLSPPAGGVNVYHLFATFNGWLYFTAVINYHQGLYKTNGGFESLQMVLPNECGGDVSLQELNGEMLITESCLGTTLWKIDKDGQNLTQIKHLGYGSGHGSMVKMGNFVFLGFLGRLWQTNGTSEGTIKILEHSSLDSLNVMDGWLYYQTEFCLMRWKNGTEEMVYCFNSLIADDFHQMTVANNRLFFISAGEDYNLPRRLWVTDGTYAGTRIIAGNCAKTQGSTSIFYTLGGTVIFGDCDAAHGYEIWTTDGTELGTKLFADINPGPGNSQFSNFFMADDKLFFAGDDGISGRELWQVPIYNSRIFLPSVNF